MGNSYFAHATADVSSEAEVGEGTRIWQQCQIREGAIIGRDCILGKGVYVDRSVRVGHRVKIQNRVSIYEGVTLEDGVFCGPHCVFTNDYRPRAVNPDGSPKSADDWTITETHVREGASIGANATIVCGIEIGRWAMVGAGSVVVHSVPDHGLVYGNPARLWGFVCRCGEKLEARSDPPSEAGGVKMFCPKCHAKVDVPTATYATLSRGSR